MVEGLSWNINYVPVVEIYMFSKTCDEGTLNIWCYMKSTFKLYILQGVALQGVACNMYVYKWNIQ